VEALKTNKLKSWMVVCCGALFYCYQFIIRVSPNVMHDELLTELSIDVLALGMILATYNWAYSSLQIPLGISIDRFGPKIFLTVASLLCALGCFLFSFITTPMMAGVARFLMGMGSACGFIGAIKLGTLWLEPKDIGKVVGLIMVFGTVGASLGGTPLSLFVDAHGFRTTMQLLGAIGLVITVVIGLLVSNGPKCPTKAMPSEKRSIAKDFMLLAKSPQSWLLAVYGMLMYAPITLMGVGWGVPFVEKACNTSEANAGLVITFMFIGAACGGPVFTGFSDYLQKRKSPMFIGSIISAVLYFVIILVPNLPLFVMYVLFFVVGFMYTAKTLTFASICEIMPLEMSGFSVAFVNAMVMAAGIIFHPFIGALIENHAQTETYALADYQYALLVIPIILSISTVMLFFIKESYPKHDKTPLDITHIQECHLEP
jgi:MFS family permease